MKHGQFPLKESQILASCEYTQNELPVRLAKRVVAFQRLPFIVGMNPYISRVYYQYYEAFDRLRAFPPIKDLESEAQFTKALLRQTQLLADVIPTIAQGFHECKKYMNIKDTTSFIDDLITARIGLRVIGEQHVDLSHQYRDSLENDNNRNSSEEQGHNVNSITGSTSSSLDSDQTPIMTTVPGLKDWVGSIHTNLQPAKLLEQLCLYVQNVCELHYGTSPEFIIDGNIDTIMTYIPSHLEYIAMELLKNAYRATIDHSTMARRLYHPPIRITVSKGMKYVGIRIRDEGGGIPKAHFPHVFEYSWTSVKERDDISSDGSAGGGAPGTFSIQANLDLQAGIGGPIGKTLQLCHLPLIYDVLT